jgi:hypothetical protein
MPKVTWKGVWTSMRTPAPMSLFTWSLWAMVWSFYGAATAADAWIDGLPGTIMTFAMLVPMPFLVWAAMTSNRRDRRVGVKPVGAP